LERPPVPIPNVIPNVSKVNKQNANLHIALRYETSNLLNAEQVIHRTEEDNLHFRENIMKQKLAYAEHVMRCPSDLNALLDPEGRFGGLNRKKKST